MGTKSPCGKLFSVLPLVLRLSLCEVHAQLQSGPNTQSQIWAQDPIGAEVELVCSVTYPRRSRQNWMGSGMGGRCDHGT
eukprot:822003-Karenia_brevis.AAC.1